MKTLNGKVVAITGAGAGLGRALSIALAKEGCSLALSDVNVAGLAETRRQIEEILSQQSGHKPAAQISLHEVDVANRDAVSRYVSETLSHHGVVDMLINNAGVIAKQTIEDISYEDFEWVMGINMWGVVYCTKAFLPVIKQRPEGHIVNISSINSMLGFPANGPYNMSKHAVLAFTETLVQELRRSGMVFTSVHPGGIKTDIVNNARHATSIDASTFGRFAQSTPEQAAKVIVQGIKNNRDKIFVGADAVIMQLMKRLFPNRSVRLTGYFMERLFNQRV